MRSKRKPPDITEADIVRFWNKVSRTDGCWEWTAYKTQGGYGQFSFRDKMIICPRFVWIITHGDIPPGIWVLHKCDNPACVRPGHLFLGTCLDNNRDRANKGRSATGIKAGRAKLTDDDIDEIIKTPTYRGHGTYLANKFGITKDYVSRLRHGRVPRGR